MMMMCWIRFEMFLFLLAAFPFGRMLSTEDWHFTERLAVFQIIGYPTEMTLHDDRLAQNKLFKELVINIPVNSTIAFSNITIKIPACKSLPNKEYYALSLCEVEVYADITCKAPSSFTHGTYVRKWNADYSFGDTLTWTCSDGYKSEQNKTRQCISTSEWSGAEPSCLLITCAYPDNISDLLLTFAIGSTYDTGSVSSRSDIGVHCQEGFKTNVTSITCTLDGEWNTLPTCSQITCNRLGILLNGTYTYTYNNAIKANHTEVKFVYGTIAEANCNATFTYKGELRACGEDGNWSGVEGTCESETGTGPSLFPMAAVGGIIAGCIGLAAVVAVISLVYLCRRENCTRTEEGSNTAPIQCTPTEIEDNPEYVNLNLETRIEDSYHFDQVHEGAIIEDTTNYEQLSIDGRSKNTHNYEPLDIAPHVVDPFYYEPLGVKAKSEDTHNYEPLDIEPHVIDPSNYEPLDVKAKSEDTHNYEPLDIEPHVVDPSNYEPLDVKAKNEDTYSYENLEMHSNI